VRTFDHTVKCPYCHKSNDIEIDPDSDDNDGEVECESCGQLFDVVNVYVEVNADAKPRPEGSRRPPPPPAPAFPPADSPLWIEALGHRWVTDGTIILRADAPLPLSMGGRRWYSDIGPDPSANIAECVTQGVYGPRSWDKSYNPAFVPIVSALIPMGASRFGREGDPVPVAVVPPYDPKAEDAVGEDGQPLKK